MGVIGRLGIAAGAAANRKGLALFGHRIIGVAGCAE